MHLGQEDSWTVTRLEETLINVSKSLSPDQSCQSYKRIKIILGNINKIDPEEMDWKLVKLLYFSLVSVFFFFSVITIPDEIIITLAL